MFTEVLQEKLLESVDFVKNKIQKSIEINGNNAEHNFYYFKNNEELGTKNTLVDLGENNIILANVEVANNVWNIFPSGIIAKDDSSKIEIFEKFSEYCLFQGNAAEVYAELETNLYDEIKNRMGNGYLISEVQFSFNWPIVDLKGFDSNLRGSKYYELRKIKNSFLRENKLEIINAKGLDYGVLKKILLDWESNRKGDDNAYSTEYKNWINTNFEGTDYAKCWVVNDKPCAIVAGWIVPNSKSFYLAVVLHNYSIKSLGEIIYLQTFLELKDLGYESCNLGGSDEKLFAFKKKFLPSSSYKTVEFSVKRK